MAQRRISLPGITISEPKAVFRPLKQETISCVLPEYYHTVAKLRLRVNADHAACWFCAQPVQQRFAVETLAGREVGSFCSRICRDSFAGMVRAHVALREEPKVTLLPLAFYQDAAEVVHLIEALRARDGVYGTCFFDERDGSITLTLRSLL